MTSEARTGQQILNQTAPGGATETLLLDRVDPADPAVRTAVERVGDRRRAAPDVRAVRTPWTDRRPARRPTPPARPWWQPTAAPCSSPSS